MGIRPGDLVTSRTIQRGVQRLWATGEYDDIRVYARDDAAGRTTLVVDVTERPLIVGYRFQGLVHIGSGGIRDTTGLEAGAPLSLAAVHEASHLIRAELSTNGYVRATIDTSLVLLEHLDKRQKAC